MSEMKKIGILTFHNAHNYGAVLQAYGLKRMLEKLGFESKIINYGNIGQTKRIELNLTGLKPFIAGMIINFLSIFGTDSRRYKFRIFKKDYLALKAKKISRSELHELNNTFDIIITGSDQVWNFDLTSNDSSYFLDFVNNPCKRISYAASLGMAKFPERNVDVIKINLMQFSAISVREAKTKEAVEQLCDMKVSQVLDPSFLLDKKDWSTIARKSKFEKPYILCFSIMAIPKRMIDYCKLLQAQTGCEIVRIVNPQVDIIKSVKTISNAGPLDFLSLVKNATYVVTNSFHCTVFSIIFQIPFFVFLYNNERDIRLKEMLGRLALSNRIVEDINQQINNLRITNFDEVNNLLSIERDNSIAFLKESLNN